MAEKALLKLLKCSICLDTYTDPRQLQCHHVFCQKCLVKLVVQDQHGQQLSLSCPICRQVTPVPANGAAGLQSAFQIKSFLEIVEDYTKARDPPADGASPAPQRKADSASIVRCPEHGKEVELYCESCQEPICLKCITKGGKHLNHDHQLINEAFEKYKKEVASSMEPMEKQVATIKDALKELDVRCGEISNQQAAIKADIHDTFERIHKVLDARKTNLIGQLQQISRKKLKGLAIQRDQIETTLAQLSSCLHFMKESLQSANGAEMLMMKMNTVNRVERLTTAFQPDILEPNTSANMVFLAPSELTIACENFGLVSSPEFADPSKCCAKLKGEDSVGKPSIVLLQALNFNGQPCDKHVPLECELVSDITGVRVTGSVRGGQQSHYEISYQPTIKGRHQLHITVHGQHVRGSPFGVTARLPAKKIRSSLLTIRNMLKPWDVAINQRGEVVVTEWEGHCVSVFSASGEKLRSFGTFGSSEGQFNHPRGVAVDNEGNILVVDRFNNRIQKFTAGGHFVMAVGMEGNKRLQFLGPRGIAFNASNGKFYITDKQNCVQVLNSDLTFFSSFKVEFNDPIGIACDRTGKVYVADNNHIQIFTPKGKQLKAFFGNGKKEPMRPVGVAIDGCGLIYVSDRTNCCVSVFTSEGRFMTSFGDFSIIGGLTMDSSEVFYVCDYNDNCIKLF